jgi:hypothetical protein
VLVGSKEVQAVTGLSADQIREWTGRRGIVVPDIPAKGKGTQARFSWQTLLVLLIARTLRDEFHVELAAFQGAFKDIQRQLRGQAFHALQGVTAVFPSARSSRLERTTTTNLSMHCNAITIHLDSHMSAIAKGLGTVAQSEQLPLFRAIGIR